MHRGTRYHGHMSTGYRHTPIGADALLISSTAAIAGLTTAAILSKNSVSAPAYQTVQNTSQQPIVINNYYVKEDSTKELD